VRLGVVYAEKGFQIGDCASQLIVPDGGRRGPMFGTAAAVASGGVEPVSLKLGARGIETGGTFFRRDLTG
jgi:hypothetical protein